MEGPLIAKYSQVESALAVRVKLPKELVHSVKGKQKSVFIALDKSGSMYSSFDSAKAAVKTLTEDLKSRGITDIVLMPYDSSTDTFEVQGATVNELDQFFKNLDADGGTNFMEVFGFLSSMLENSFSDPAVVFFSDGQDTSDPTDGKVHVEEAFHMLRVALTRPGMTSEVHSIGFTEEHDAVLLGKIVRLGTSQGTFQYVKQANDITAALDNVAELIAGQKIAATLVIGQGQPVPLLLDDQFSATVFLQQADFNPQAPAEVQVGDKKVLVSFEKDSDRSVALLVIKYIESELQHMQDIVVAKPSRQQLEAIKARVTEFDNRLNTLVKDCFKLPRADRKTAIQDVQSTKDLVGRFHGLLAQAFSSTLTNDAIATFTALAYRKVTKKGLLKKLDQRVEKNVKMYEELEDKIEQAVASVDFDALEARTTEAEKEELTCALSMMNFVEAAQDGDCLCITLDVARTQAAIADPTQLIIKAVNSTFMTADTFMDSVKYAVEAAENPAEAHGGFGRDTIGSIVKGLAREDITACMPLYINDDHWKVAKLKMRPVMGWVTTLDIMGYTYSQIKTVPFLVLGKLMEEAAGGSAFKTKLFNMVLDTCMAIYRDSNMHDEVKEQFWNYSRSPLNRTIDVIANNPVFMGYLLCAQRNQMLDPAADTVTFHRFVQQIIEEEARRRVSFRDDIVIDDMCALLGVDKNYYVNTPLDKFKQEYTAYMANVQAGQGESRWKATIRSLLGAEAAVVEEKDANSTLTAPVAQAPVFNGQIEVTELANRFIRKCAGVVSPGVHLIRQFTKLMERKENALTEDYSRPVALHQSEKKMLALYLQNYLQRRNSDRREAISENRYLDPFSEDNEVAIFKNVIDALVVGERNKKMNDVINAEAAKNSSNVAAVFETSKDEEEAAGVLKLDCRFRGNGDGTYKRVIQSLFSPKCPQAANKIRMLATGQYKGITLFCDNRKDASGGTVPVSWTPSPGNFHKIWTAHMNEFTKEQWIELFPAMTDKIKRKYSVLDGSYFPVKKSKSGKKPGKR